MIQRIQTLYLFLTTVLSIIFLNGRVIKFMEGPKNILDVSSDGLKLTDNVGGQATIWILLSMTALVLLIMLVSVVALFLFKKRRLQMHMAAGLMTLVLLLIIVSVIYYIYISGNYSGEISPGLNMFLLPIMLLTSWLAFRGIKKDEELVKSYDRLR